jgi:putative copper export protein
MSHLKRLKRAVANSPAAIWAAVLSFVMLAYRLGSRLLGADPLADDPDTVVATVRQTSTVIAAVVIGVVAIVGIYIYDQVYSTMPTPDNSDLSNSTDSVTSGFGSAMEFVPVILIVLMAVVVIGAVQRLRGQ